MPQRDEHLQPLTDGELVARANAGDHRAFECLYERHRDWVVNLACRFTRGDRALALDVMQETFAHLLTRFPGFTLTAHMKTYLYPVVRHTALALARQSRRRMMLPDRAGPATAAPGSIAQGAAPLRHDASSAPAREPSPLGADCESLAALQAALDALDPGHREVVILRFADDLSLQEIALAMAIPLGTVKSRLHNALASLRQNSALANFFDPA